ncbi:MAG: hypothetical protein ACE5GY_01725 [Thermodesulfobacteriota bacterium]
MKFIFVTAVLLFMLSTAIHVAVWRIRKPGNRPFALICIYILIPFIAALAGLALTVSGGLPVATPEEIAAVYLLNLALSSSYVLTYPAIEALSPSLLFLLIIDSSRRGVIRSSLVESFDDGSLLEPRIRDLLESGMLRESPQGYSLSSSAVLMVRFFKAFRRLLGLPQGGG